MSIRVDKELAAARSAEKRGALAEAQQHYIQVLEHFPGNARARAGLTALAERLEPVWRALAPADEHLQQSHALRTAGRLEEARQLINALLTHFPESHAVRLELGQLAEAMQQPQAAIDAYEQALALRPDYVDALVAMGHLLEISGQEGMAIGPFLRAVAIDPANPALHFRVGRLHAAQRRHREAAQAFEQSLAINPAHTMTWMLLSMQYRFLREPEREVAALEAALALEPGHVEAQALLTTARLMVADWSARPDEAALTRLSAAAGRDGLFVLDSDPARMLSRSRFTASRYGAPPVWIKPAAPDSPGRLRIGYVSSDFYSHATMYLMAGMLREADRERFELHAYVIGGGNVAADPMRQKLHDWCDGVHDLTSLDDTAAVRLVRDHKLDLAVDLKGYTHDARTLLFARRLAPVQVSWLGYCGSMGAPFIDYMVADATVIPPDLRKYYSESLILLPHCYQPNDDQRPIVPSRATRKELGLPPQGFVFCTFNATWKIGPAEFDVWMRLLLAVPGSVLWLCEQHASTQANLRREAAARGVDPARLVFAANLPHHEHLGRMVHADLFLDSFNCNAHTTASDSLWAGLPLVTCAGSGFPARVAASLLNAAGLPDLVTASPAEYEALALALATDPARLAQVRDRLAKQRAACPLFDTVGFTRALERGWEAAITRSRQGLRPADIIV